MSTIIIYMSKHGTTEKVSKIIKDQLKDKMVDMTDLRSNSHPSLNNFDTVLIGASIHMGQIQKKVKDFCVKNLEVLLKKNIGLFLCCMYKDKRQEQFDNSFSEVLRNHSIAKGMFGGEFVFERMNFFEKLIVKKIVHVNETKSEIDNNAIEKFVENLNRE